ncbi:MAG: NYN domain-containing protein [Actinomycetota bacterium]|nr:NYN domain-containing protein [Actinomycetota bacterium]
MTRWIVDAMNVIGSRPDRWWNDPDRAMREMADAVDGYAVATETDITLVFDKDPGDLPSTTRIEIVIASRSGRDAADHEIVQLVEEDDDPGSLRVVTSDRRLVERVTDLGAGITSAGRFRRDLDRISE